LLFLRGVVENVVTFGKKSKKNFTDVPWFQNTAIFFRNGPEDKLLALNNLAKRKPVQ
jgi:hypothetical protein